MIKILLVEDDSQMIRLYEQKLVKEGFEVEVAMNGSDGLEVALDTKPDLIILDLLMPKMDGEKMLESLREDDWGKMVPVIILTNVSEAKDPNTESRAEEYVLKADMDIDDLIVKIKQHIK